ncbi:hypothetical protein L6164_035001 [Bauhinia variegata]|uniref:Uncharacterized protein n=1 Tax=Bauhinia variegata TaxID=167791 RepID=A0ACB9KX79_BAUVA|nr:hypothetical protein L6164_035001 [Bauhinia variegata]
MDPFVLLEGLYLTKIMIFLTHHKFVVVTAFLAALLYFINSTKRVYLVDFVCYRAPDYLRVPISSFLEHLEISGTFRRETIDFQTKVLERSGLGNETYLPIRMHQLPSVRTLNSSLAEVESVFFPLVRKLFSKHRINPRSIDILITNCSLFCPTPSLASTVINEFGFRSNIRSYNLAGMGCSAGLLSIALARDLLKVHKNSMVLILSMESVCSNVYQGNVKSMLLANCLFRMGGAAILLSNRERDRDVAKYELKHLVRTHLGSKDSFYECVTQKEDDEGFTGVFLSRSILKVAGEALKANMGKLGGLVLPYSEKIHYGLSVMWRRMWPPARKRGPYTPDFRKAFEHFCIHAGGKGVITGIKDKLKLRDKDVEASRMTLHRFGNTSSSSTWYSLGYLEAKGWVKTGDRVWQLAFGSGFKCNSAVWKCISKVNHNQDQDHSNVWSDLIHQYPAVVPDVIDH